MSNSDIHDTTYNKYNKINMILKKYYNVNNTNPELEWWEEPYQKQDQKVLSENIISEHFLTQNTTDNSSNPPPLNIIYNVIDICYNINDFSFNGISIQITENQKILENSINDDTERRIDIDLSQYDVSNIVITDAVSNDVSYNPTLTLINRLTNNQNIDFSMNKDFFIESQTNRLSVSIEKLEDISGTLRFKYYSYKRDNTDLSDGYFDTGINTLSKLNNIYVQDISFSSESIQLFKPQIDLSFSIVCNNLYIYDDEKNYKLVPTDGSALTGITLNAGERGEKGDNPAADLDGSPGDDYKFSKYKTNFFIEDKEFIDSETPDGINLSKKLKDELDNNFTFITGPQGDSGFIGGRGLKNPQEFSHEFTNIIDDYFESEDRTGFCNIGNIQLKSGVKFDIEVLKRNGFYRRTESASNIEKDLEKCDVYTMFPFAVKKNNADPTTCAWSGIVCNLHNHTIEGTDYDKMNLLKKNSKEGRDENVTHTFIAGGDYSKHNKKKYWTDDHIFFSNIFQYFAAPSDFSQRNHFRKLWKHTNPFKNMHDSHWKYDTDYEIETTTGTLGADNFFSCWIFYPHDRVASQNGEDAGTYLTKKMSIGKRRERDKIKKRFIPITETIETAKVEEVQYFDGETFWLDMLYFSRVKLRIPSMVTYHSLSSTRIQNSWIMYDKLNYSSNPDASFNDASMNTGYTKPLRFKKWQLMHFNIFLHNCVYNSIQNTDFPNYYEMFNEYQGLLLPVIAGKTNSTKLANTLYNIHYDKRTNSFMKLPVYSGNRYKISVLPSILHKQTLNALDVFWRLWIMQGTWRDPSNNMMGYREPIRIKDYRSQHTFKNGNRMTDLMEYDRHEDDKQNNNYKRGINRKYLNTISRGFKPYNNNSDFLISNMGTGLGVPVNTDAMGCGFNADSTINQSLMDKNSPYKLERWMYGKNRYQADFLWSINSEWLPSFNTVLDKEVKDSIKNLTGLYMGDGTLTCNKDASHRNSTTFPLFEKPGQNEFLSITFKGEAKDRKYGSLRHYNLNYRYRWPFYNKILYAPSKDVNNYLTQIAIDGYDNKYLHSTKSNNDLLFIQSGGSDAYQTRNAQHTAVGGAYAGAVVGGPIGLLIAGGSLLIGAAEAAGHGNKTQKDNWTDQTAVGDAKDEIFKYFNPRWENTNQVPQTIFTDRYDFENYMYEYNGDWGPSYNNLSNVLHGTFQDIIMNEPSVIYNKKYLKKWNGQKLLIDVEEMNVDYIKLEGSGGKENWNPTITKNSWANREDRRKFLKHPRNKLNLKHSTHKSHWNQGYYDDMHFFQPTRKWWLVDMYKEHINQFKINRISIEKLNDVDNSLVEIWNESSNIETYKHIFNEEDKKGNAKLVKDVFSWKNGEDNEPEFTNMTIQLDVCANYIKDQIPFFKLSINHDIFKYLRNPTTKKYYTINDNFIPIYTNGLSDVSNEITKVSVWQPSSEIFDSKIIIRFHLLNTNCDNGLEFFQDGSFSTITIRNSNERDSEVVLFNQEFSISEEFKKDKTQFNHNWVDIMYEIDTTYYEEDEIHPINKLTNDILNKTSYVDIHLTTDDLTDYYFNGIPIVSSINKPKLVMNDICIIDALLNYTVVDDVEIILTFSDDVEIDCLNTIYRHNVEYLLETYINPTINIKAYGKDISNILYNIPFHISRKKLLYEGLGKNDNKIDISYNEHDASLNVRMTNIKQIEHKYKCIKINDLDVEEMNKDFKLYCYYNGLDCSNLFYDFSLNSNEIQPGEKGLHNLLRDQDFFKDSVIKSEPENIWNMLLDEYNNCLNLEFYIQKMDNNKEITFQRMPYTEINRNVNYYEKENFIKSLDILGLHYTNINEKDENDKTVDDNIEFYILPLTFIRNDNHIDKNSYNENIYITSGSNDLSKLSSEYDVSFSKALWKLQFNSLCSERKSKTLKKSDLKKIWPVENQITLNNKYVTIIDQIASEINAISNIKWNDKKRITILSPSKYKNEEYLRWKIKLTRNVIPFMCLVKQLEYHLIYKFGENVRTPDEITVIKKSILTLATFVSIEKAHRVTKDEFIDWFTESNIDMIMNNKDINSNFNRDTLLNSLLDKNAVNDFKYMYKKFITEGDGMAKFYDFDFRNEMKLLKGLDFDYNINLTWPNDPVTDILEIAADNNAKKGADKLPVFNVLENGKRDEDGNLDNGSQAQYLLGRVIVPYDIMTNDPTDDPSVFNTPHFKDNIATYIYPERQSIFDDDFYEVPFNYEYIIRSEEKNYIYENNNIQKYKSNDVLSLIIDTVETMNMETILNIYNKRQKWYNSNTIHTMGAGSVCLIFDNLLKIYGDNHLSSIIKQHIELLEINDFDETVFDEFLKTVLDNADDIMPNTTSINDIITIDDEDDGSADYIYSFTGYRLNKAFLYESFNNLIMISDSIQLMDEINLLSKSNFFCKTKYRNDFSSLYPSTIFDNDNSGFDYIKKIGQKKFGNWWKPGLWKNLFDENSNLNEIIRTINDELINDAIGNEDYEELRKIYNSLYGTPPEIDVDETIMQTLMRGSGFTNESQIEINDGEIEKNKKRVIEAKQKAKEVQQSWEETRKKKISAQLENNKIIKVQYITSLHFEFAKTNPANAALNLPAGDETKAYIREYITEIDTFNKQNTSNIQNDEDRIKKFIDKLLNDGKITDDDKRIFIFELLSKYPKNLEKKKFMEDILIYIYEQDEGMDLYNHGHERSAITMVETQSKPPFAAHIDQTLTDSDVKKNWKKSHIELRKVLTRILGGNLPARADFNNMNDEAKKIIHEMLKEKTTAAHKYQIIKYLNDYHKPDGALENIYINYIETLWSDIVEPKNLQPTLFAPQQHKDIVSNILQNNDMNNEDKFTQILKEINTSWLNMTETADLNDDNILSIFDSANSYGDTKFMPTFMNIIFGDDNGITQEEKKKLLNFTEVAELEIVEYLKKYLDYDSASHISDETKTAMGLIINNYESKYKNFEIVKEKREIIKKIQKLPPSKDSIEFIYRIWNSYGEDANAVTARRGWFDILLKSMDLENADAIPNNIYFEDLVAKIEDTDNIHLRPQLNGETKAAAYINYKKQLAIYLGTSSQGSVLVPAVYNDDGTIITNAVHKQQAQLLKGMAPRDVEEIIKHIKEHSHNLPLEKKLDLLSKFEKLINLENPTDETNTMKRIISDSIFGKNQKWAQNTTEKMKLNKMLADILKDYNTSDINKNREKIIKILEMIISNNPPEATDSTNKFLLKRLKEGPITQNEFSTYKVIYEILDLSQVDEDGIPVGKNPTINEWRKSQSYTEFKTLLERSAERTETEKIQFNKLKGEIYGRVVNERRKKFALLATNGVTTRNVREMLKEAQFSWAEDVEDGVMLVESPTKVNLSEFFQEQIRIAEKMSGKNIVSVGLGTQSTYHLSAQDKTQNMQKKTNLSVATNEHYRAQNQMTILTDKKDKLVAKGEKLQKAKKKLSRQRNINRKDIIRWQFETQQFEEKRKAPSWWQFREKWKRFMKYDVKEQNKRLDIVKKILIEYRDYADNQKDSNGVHPGYFLNYLHLRSVDINSNIIGEKTARIRIDKLESIASNLLFSIENEFGYSKKDIEMQRILGVEIEFEKKLQKKMNGNSFMLANRSIEDLFNEKTTYRNIPPGHNGTITNNFIEKYRMSSPEEQKIIRNIVTEFRTKPNGTVLVGGLTVGEGGLALGEPERIHVRLQDPPTFNNDEAKKKWYQETWGIGDGTKPIMVDHEIELREKQAEYIKEIFGIDTAPPKTHAAIITEARAKRDELRPYFDRRAAIPSIPSIANGAVTNEFITAENFKDVFDVIDHNNDEKNELLYEVMEELETGRDRKRTVEISAFGVATRDQKNRKIKKLEDDIQQFLQGTDPLTAEDRAALRTKRKELILFTAIDNTTKYNNFDSAGRVLNEMQNDYGNHFLDRNEISELQKQLQANFNNPQSDWPELIAEVEKESGVRRTKEDLKNERNRIKTELETLEAEAEQKVAQDVEDAREAKKKKLQKKLLIAKSLENAVMVVDATDIYSGLTDLRKYYAKHKKNAVHDYTDALNRSKNIDAAILEIDKELDKITGNTDKSLKRIYQLQAKKERLKRGAGGSLFGSDKKKMESWNRKNRFAMTEILQLNSNNEIDMEKKKRLLKNVINNPKIDVETKQIIIKHSGLSVDELNGMFDPTDPQDVRTKGNFKKTLLGNNIIYDENDTEKRVVGKEGTPMKKWMVDNGEWKEVDLEPNDFDNDGLKKYKKSPNAPDIPNDMDDFRKNLDADRRKIKPGVNSNIENGIGFLEAANDMHGGQNKEQLTDTIKKREKDKTVKNSKEYWKEKKKQFTADRKNRMKELKAAWKRKDIDLDEYKRRISQSYDDELKFENDRKEAAAEKKKIKKRRKRVKKKMRQRRKMVALKKRKGASKLFWRMGFSQQWNKMRKKKVLVRGTERFKSAKKVLGKINDMLDTILDLKSMIMKNAMIQTALLKFKKFMILKFAALAGKLKALKGAAIAAAAAAKAKVMGAVIFMAVILLKIIIVAAIIAIIASPVLLSMMSLTGFDRKPFHNIMNRWEATLGRTYHLGNPWREQMRPGVRVLKGHHVYDTMTTNPILLTGITDGNPYDSGVDQSAMSIYTYGIISNHDINKPVLDNLFIPIYPKGGIPYMSGKRSTSYIWDLYYCFWGVRTSQYQWLTSRRKKWNWSVYRDNFTNGMGQYIRDIVNKSGYKRLIPCTDKAGSEVNTKGRMLQNPTEWWSVECVNQELTDNNKFKKNNKLLTKWDDSDTTLCVITTHEFEPLHPDYDVKIKANDNYYIKGPKNKQWFDNNEYKGYYTIDNIQCITMVVSNNSGIISKWPGEKWPGDTDGVYGDLQYEWKKEENSIQFQLCLSPTNEFMYYPTKIYDNNKNSKLDHNPQAIWKDNIHNEFSDHFYKHAGGVIPNPGTFLRTKIQNARNRWPDEPDDWKTTINPNLKTTVNYIYKVLRPNDQDPYGRTMVSKRPYFIVGEKTRKPINHWTTTSLEISNSNFKTINFGDVVSNKHIPDGTDMNKSSRDTDTKYIVSVISKIDDPDMSGVYDFIKNNYDDTILPLYVKSNTQMSKITFYDSNGSVVDASKNHKFVPHRRWDTIYTDLLNVDWNVYTYLNWQWDYNKIDDELGFVSNGFAGNVIYNNDNGTFKDGIISNNGTKLVKTKGRLPRNQDIPAYLHCWWLYDMFDGGLKKEEYENKDGGTDIAGALFGGGGAAAIVGGGAGYVAAGLAIGTGFGLALAVAVVVIALIARTPDKAQDYTLILHPSSFEHEKGGIVRTKIPCMYQVGRQMHFCQAMHGTIKASDHFKKYLGWHIHRKKYWNKLKFSAVIDTELVAKYIYYECDRRIKRNITPLSNEYCIDIVNKLQTKTYKIRGQYKDDTTNYGFIAQEIEKVLPIAVKKVRSIIPNVSRYTHDFNWYDIRNVPKTHLDDSMPKNTKYILKINDLKKSEVSNETNACYEFVIQYVNKSNKTINKRVTLIKSNKYNNEFYIDEKMDNINHIFIKGYSINDMRTVNHSAIFNHHTGAVKYLIKKGKDLKKRREETIASIDAKREKIQKMKSLLMEKERRLIKLKQRLKNINI